MDVCAIGELVAAEESITLVQAHGKRADIVVKMKYIQKKPFLGKIHNSPIKNIYFKSNKSRTIDGRFHVVIHYAQHVNLQKIFGKFLTR